jgi:hypothetical protein
MATKTKEKKYREVEVLPKSAMSVRQYAEAKGCTTAALYMAQKDTDKNDFEIVTFKSYNFVIPKKKKK